MCFLFILSKILGMKAIRVYANVEELIDVENNLNNYTTSRFFGIPYFEEGFVWPLDEWNDPLHFMCQINLIEIESTLYQDLLPKEGILQFYFSGDFNQYCITHLSQPNSNLILASSSKDLFKASKYSFDFN